MTVIFGTLRDVGGQLAQGTVTVASLVTRPAHGDAATVITKERHVLPLRNGAFESPEMDPGPVRVEATTGGAFESWEVTLPEDGRHDLATLVESQHVYEPPVVGAAQAAAQEAVAARADAVSAADAAQGSATTAQGHADRAATEAGAAAQIAAQEKIAELVGDAPNDLDTIYELAAAFADRGDAIAAIQSALANRVIGNHSSVISSTVPGVGTPSNQVTFVVEGT